MDDAGLRAVLAGVKVVALVGYSEKPDRPSHHVAAYLHARGIRVIAVNPALAGKVALGETVAGSLAQIAPEIASQVDMVDIFRASEAVPMIVAEALAHLPALKTVWMQLGVVSEEGAQMAQAAGKTVVMDRCPKIEMPRLGV